MNDQKINKTGTAMINQLRRDIRKIRLLERHQEFITLGQALGRLLRDRADHQPIKTLWYPSADRDMRPLYYFLNFKPYDQLRSYVEEPDLFIFTCLTMGEKDDEYILQERFKLGRSLQQLGFIQDIKVHSRELIYHNRSEHPFVNEYALFGEDPHERGRPDGYLLRLALNRDDGSTIEKTLIYMFHENIGFFNRWILNSGFFTPDAFQLHTLVCSREGCGDGGCGRSALIHWLGLPEALRHRHRPRYIVAFDDYTGAKLRESDEAAHLTPIDDYLPDYTYHPGRYNNTVYELSSMNVSESQAPSELISKALLAEAERAPRYDLSFVEGYDWSRWSGPELIDALTLAEVTRYTPHLVDDYIISKLSNDTPLEALLPFEGSGSVYTQALVDLVKRRALNRRFPTSKLNSLEALKRALIECRRHCIFLLLQSHLQLALELFHGLSIRALNLKTTSLVDAHSILKAVTPLRMLQLPPGFDLTSLDPLQLAQLRTLKCVEPKEGTLGSVTRLPHLARLQLERCPVDQLEALRSDTITELVLTGYELNTPIDLRGLSSLKTLVCFGGAPIEARTLQPVERLIDPQAGWLA